MRSRLAAASLLFGLLVAGLAAAAEIKVLTAGAFKPVVLGVTADFEARTGHKLIVDNDTAGGLLRRISGGEAFDVAILTPAAVKELVEKGKVATGTPRNLARTAVGVAVKEGAPRPAIATTAEFKAALLAAKKVAYIDPAAGGSSGIYFDRLLGTMGIADAVRAKAVLVPGGLVAERLVSGEADLAIHQISEILAVRGAALVGPLPAEIQNYTVYAGGVAAGAAQPEPARLFLGYLAGSDAVRTAMTSRGLEPVGD